MRIPPPDTDLRTDDPRIRHRRTVALYVAILLIEILFQTVYYRADNTIDRDSVFYINGVNIWYETGDFSMLPKMLIVPGNTTAMKYYTAPFYIFILKTLKCAFPGASIEFLALIWGMTASCVATLMTMLTAGLIFKDDLAACFSGLLLALHPRIAELATSPLREMTYLMIVTAVVYLLTRAVTSRDPRFSAAAGLFIFAGMTCRVEFMALMAVLTPIALWDIVMIRKRSLRIWGFFLIGGVAGYVFWTLLMGIPWDFLPVYIRRFIK